MRRSQSNRKLQSNMKLTHQRTSRYDNAPESLTDWLEEQLDSRGIDAVVYTRYILSLLLEDSSDSDDDIGGGGGLSSVSASDINRCSCKQTCAKDNIRPVTSTKWKHKRYLKQIQSNNGVNNSCVNAGTDWLSHSEYCLHSCPMNGDEERRLAVVECLKSASEQESGIESFVDELCAKLKTIKSLSETSEMVADSKADINCNNGVKKAVTRQEMAIKYYAAFPSLDTNSVDDTNANTVSKADTIEPTVQKKSVKNKIQWNGQKIIEFMSKGSLDGVLFLYSLMAFLSK
ncbi:unnamed protein product [Medioppia subpectinata]|uniref:Uncharacterized protein n=1 Tax=Medioppia subpectinata TaxID=1979941 RepID=A0A7R9KR40_9ACAR|nr:unnamed protein product [Medioppia subpectinata]CAG2107167.1 unnamed protein product [Medioppia subpectinata]